MRIVLAYSGSVYGSAGIAWLRERYRAEVVTATVDLGHGRTLEAIRDQALALGAQRAHVLDGRELFASQFIIPALRADALHEGRVPMASALSRPLIVQKVAELAAIERADAVAHCGREALPSSRLDRLFRDAAPGLTVLAPVLEWDLTPDDLDAFARRHGLAASDVAHPAPEMNVWGQTVSNNRGGQLAPRLSDSCPEEPAFVDIAFIAGVPTSLNGVSLPLLELVASLGTLAAIHGIGFVTAGQFSCNAPAAVLLHAAHRALTRSAWSAELEQLSTVARAAYVAAVESGAWFSPLRLALDAYFAAAQSGVSGHARLRLHKGSYVTTETELVQPVDIRPPLLPSLSQH